MRLKTGALLAAALVLGAALSAGPALPASADELVVGVVADQDGVPVANARIVARGAGGAPVGSGASAADGSFALGASAAASRVEVACAYCLDRSVALVPGEPALLIVRRFGALRDRGAPGPADFAALPPQTLAGAATLVPFAVAAGGEVSDRGLALGRDASAADGVPLYRRIDGISLADLVPAVALRRLDALDGAFEAGLASAGAPALRAATGAAGGGALALGSAPVSLLAASGNGAYDLASAAARLPFAGGTLTSTALAADWFDERLAGGTLAYATASRRYETAAALALARSVVDEVPDAELLFDAHLRARNAAALTLGVRGRTSSGGGPAPGTQTENAAYASALAPLPGGTLSGGLAVERQAYPSLAYDASTGGFALHAALTTYALAPAPGGPADFARARRAELSLERGDLHRLNVLATVYQERTRGGIDSELNGAGLRLDWQIAPRLALRSWLLGANRSVAAVAPNVPAGGYLDGGASYGYGPPAALAQRIDRRLVWLTYENALRVDLVYRGGPFDASVSAPFARARLALGTTTAIDGRRVLSFSLSR
jgi:hypothetical protein